MRSPAHATASAAGKVILFGEHAVVHGVPAIAAGIARGVTANVQASESCGVSIDGRIIEQKESIYAALSALLSHLNLPPAEVSLTLRIPAGVGLGASASMAVATARALCLLFKRSESERQIFHAAQGWEKVFHGTPSGVDVAAAQSGGVIRFVRGGEPEPLVIHAPLTLVVAQAGPPASTKLMVESVQRHKERNLASFERTLAGISALVDNATLLLRSGDLRAVGKLMDLNQMLLAGWMLSTEEIETVCRTSRDAGAFGAKLTGSGGGGCVIALAGSARDPLTGARAQAISEALLRVNVPCFITQVEAGAQGKIS